MTPSILTSMRSHVVPLLLTGVLTLYGCSSLPGAATPTATPLPPIAANDQIVADARVVPVQSVNVRFQITGTVAELLVKEGDQVAADAPLARLDSRDVDIGIEHAQVVIEQAQANYNRLVEGASTEDIAAAEAQVTQAQAGLRQATANVTAQDIAAAKAQLEQARATLAQLEAGPKATQVTSARANLDAAQANLQAQRDGLSQAKTNAQLQIDQASNQLRDRQADYSRIYWSNRELEDQLSKIDQDLPQSNKDLEEQALHAVENAESAVNTAKLAYNQATLAEKSGLAAAEARVRDAQALLDQLLAGADKDQLAAARAQVSQAQANLTRLQGDQRSASLDAASAGITSARANLDRVKAGPRAAELAQAKTQIKAAEVGLKDAQLLLDKTTLRAPFAGTIAELNLKVGEVLDVTKPAAVLADFTQWQIETEDLTELSVVRINVGDEAKITFDALPSIELTGNVSQIKPIGRNSQGDIVYTVVIRPTSWDERLRWNMTASVTIAPKN